MFNNISLRLQSSLFTSGTDFARKVGKAVHEKKDTREGYEESQKGFTLADKAMEGVHDIADYDPELADYGVLTKGRMGNSNSYDLDPNSQAYQKKKGEFEDAAEAARQGAVSMRKSTEDIGFGDLYSVFSEINKRTQAGNADGGKLRGEGAGSQSEGISGVSSGVLGEDTFRTLSTIASKMNEIKKVKDRDLQKTQAIQLAAYAYQMSISEHVFRDGNGRSCRLLADTVLQTFGLPPHTPLDEESKIGGSIGNKMDFDKGAQVFLGGVKSSDAKMKSEGKVPPKAPVVPGKQAAEAAAPIKDMGKQDKKKKSWKFWKR
jgi:prophage maintenance system killer protein